MPFRRIAGTVLIAVAGTTGLLHGDEPEGLGNAKIEKLHQMIKPQPGESRWMEIDWYPSVWEARQKAAAQGKPIFLMAGSALST